MAALLGVGACSAGGSSSSQATPPGRRNTPGRRRAAGDRADRPRAQHAALAFLRGRAGPGGRAGLHHAERPGRLRQTRRQAHQPRPRHDPGHRAEEPAAGDPAGQPGRPRRAQGWGSRPRWRRASARPWPPEYDIVGFDPRGVGSSVPALSCDPGFFSGPRPNYIPANAAAEQVLINRAKTYATDCGKKVRLAAAPYDDRGRGPRHGRHPRGVRGVENQLLRLLLRHLSRPGLRDPFPRPGPADGAG